MTGEPIGPSPAAPAILVVEDDAQMAGLLAELLTQEGYAVDTVGDGAAALEQLQVRPYALIISDLRMPRLDGLGLYRALARTTPHLCSRMIMITGYELACESQRFQDEAGVPILRKPFRLHDLLRLVRLMLTGNYTERHRADGPLARAVYRQPT